MSPTLDAFLLSWPFDPWLLVALLLSAGVYLRGWRVLVRRDSRRWHAGQPAAFLGGLAAIYLALASPVEPFSSLLLQVHMVQHLLLMMVAPPLLWLGAPLFPLLRGLPGPVRTYWVAPLFRSPWLRRLCERLTHPATALPLFVAATWLWHVPPVYDLALRSPAWHYLEHVCFLATALLFWYPAVRPYPARPRWSPWLLFPYLILADVQNTVLSALFTFSDRVLYPYYAEVPRLGGLSALDDQSAAGVIMWVPGSVVFLVPLFAIGVRLLSGAQGDKVTRWQGDKVTGTKAPAPRIALTVITPPPTPVTRSPCHPVTLSPCHPVTLSPCHPVTLSGFDVLRVPLLGRFLRWRHARLALQFPLLLLAVVVIIDGLRGPQVGAMNLAGVLPWIHWRGLVVLALLTAGNFFCMACPFMLPRTLARRWLPRGRAWPRRLRNKWPAVVLVVLFLWAYEAFALWDSPWWTAWLALGYFGAAFVVDGLFRGASFCKYLCPIGQFNFVQSLVSPLEIKTRDPAVCTTCRGKECIRGTAPPLSPAEGPLFPLGEESPLFLPSSPRGKGPLFLPSPLWGEGSGVRGLAPTAAPAVEDCKLQIANCKLQIDDVRQGVTHRDAHAGPLSPHPNPSPQREEGLPGSALSGCELHLFLPRKSGNMDCTFCLDCVHACPHDNIGLLAVPPARDLWHDRFRSGVGRWARRPDLAALVLVLVFGAFANAAGMVGPVLDGQDRVQSLLGLASPLLVTTAFYALALLVLPAVAVTSAAELTRRWARLPTGRLELATRYAFALVPLGFGMWLAHYSFHFLTSYDTAVPTAQRFAADLGWKALGDPAWTAACCRPAPAWLPRLEILFLQAGLLLSLYTSYRISVAQSPRLRQALGALAPWAFLMVALFAAGVWIILQPMQMRGVLPGMGS